MIWNSPLGVTATSFVRGFVTLFLRFSPCNKHNSSVLGCVGKGTQMDDNPNQPCHGSPVQCLGYWWSSLGHAVQPGQPRWWCCLLACRLGHASKRVIRTPLCLVPLPWDTWGSQASVVSRGALQLALSHECAQWVHTHTYSRSPSSRHKEDPATTANFTRVWIQCWL